MGGDECFVCVCVWGGDGGWGGGGFRPPAQTQSCDRTWPYLIKGRRSLPNNWAIKDYFYPHNRGAVGGGGGREGEKEGGRAKESGRVEGGRVAVCEERK